MSGLREALEAFTYASDDGTEWEHANPGCQGEPDCAACWAETIRRALADHPAKPEEVVRAEARQQAAKSIRDEAVDEAINGGLALTAVIRICEETGR